MIQDRIPGAGARVLGPAENSGCHRQGTGLTTDRCYENPREEPLSRLGQRMEEVGNTPKRASTYIELEAEWTDRRSLVGKGGAPCEEAGHQARWDAHSWA